MKTHVELMHAFRQSIPTLFAYFPLGIVFSVLWLKAGFPGFWAPILSVLVYGGSVQFVALSMMQEQASVLAIVIAASFISFRNVFYGLNFIDRFKAKPRFIRCCLIFGLVDATYAMLIANPEKSDYDDTVFCSYISFFPFLYWIVGTLMGLILFDSMPNIRGLDFMLTSFFMILVIDYYLLSRDSLSLYMPIVFGLIAFMLLPKQYLLLSIIFSVIFIQVSETKQNKKTQGGP